MGLKGWPLKLVQHITESDATCISTSPACPHGSCPLQILYLSNLSFVIGMSTRAEGETMFCM